MRSSGTARRSLMLVLLCCGCAKFSLRPPAPAARPAEDTPKPNARELRTELAALRSEATILQSRLRELAARERALAIRLRQAEFLNKQLAKQIEILGQLPAERDHYKHQAEDLALEVARLRKQLEKRKPPATRPH